VTVRHRGRTSGVLAALTLVLVLSACTSPATSATSGGTPTPLAAAPSRAFRGGHVAKPHELVALYAQVRLSSMTLQQKVAELFMVHVPGTDAAAWKSVVDSTGVGGLILMGDNIAATTTELAASTTSVSTMDAGLTKLISVDEEGGDVARLPQDGFPAADTLKALPASATGDAFASRAALVQSSGISVNFGVIADVTADPASFIYSRVLGTDPQSASDRVTAAVTAERGSVFTTLKHFPGHGETEADSHTSIPAAPLDHDAWLARDAPPFEAGISAGAEVVMFGHLIYSGVDSLPASLSPKWHQILRDELGFTGVTVTDDMRMLQDSGLPQYQDPNENAIEAVAAGNDLLLYVTPGDTTGMIQAVTAAVQSGRIPESRIDEAALRVLDLQRELWLRQHPAPAG
jgi:beta-N-acetylhexosaminidase